MINDGRRRRMYWWCWDRPHWMLLLDSHRVVVAAIAMIVELTNASLAKDIHVVVLPWLHVLLLFTKDAGTTRKFVQVRMVLLTGQKSGR